MNEVNTEPPPLAVGVPVLVSRGDGWPTEYPNGSLGVWALPAEQLPGVNLNDLTPGTWVFCWNKLRQIMSLAVIGDAYHFVTQGRTYIEPRNGSRDHVEEQLLNAAGIHLRDGGRQRRKFPGPGHNP